MKRLILFAAIAIAAGAMLLSSCEKDNKNKQWDPTAMISLRAAKNPKANAAVRAEGHLSPLEIVKQTHNMYYHRGGLDYDQIAFRGFGEGQRDYANERLLMFGTDVIAQEGNYAPGFIEGHGVVLVRILYNEENIPDPDTIAYVPNQVLRDAQKIIKPAYDRGDYDLVYKTFDTAFTFIPITGPEWQELKRQGLN